MTSKLVKFFLIFLIVFGIAFFYFEKSNLFGFFNSEDEVVQSDAPEVMGAHDINTEDIDDNRENSDIALERSFPIVNFQPIRKEGMADLVVPNAHASLILDVDSGTILHYQAGKELRQIASLTKMMTALMVLENVEDLDELVTIDEDSMYVDGTKVGCPRSDYCIGTRLQKQEKISARSLLKAMLMNSANDAATALGKHVGGTVDGYVRMMNDRAREMGLTDSNFCTPSGLELAGLEETCYSTAYDIARIAAQTMQYDVIWDILQTSEDIIYSADGKYSHDLRTTDKILNQMEGCLGGKTGFTPLAGHSLLMGAQDPTGRHKIIMVVLDDPYRWEDVQMMADWTFESYEWK